MTVTFSPGDVVCVRTTGLAARLVRFGASIRYLITGGSNVADLTNHILVVSHQTDGVWWAIEGRPGGVGWADLTRYADAATTITNYAQPKTDEQRAQLLACIPQVLGAPYSWTAIMRAVADDLHIPQMFRTNWNGQGAPGHLICSSLADWMYYHVGLAAPKPDRLCQPSDWEQFCVSEGWK